MGAAWIDAKLGGSKCTGTSFCHSLIKCTIVQVQGLQHCAYLFGRDRCYKAMKPKRQGFVKNLMKPDVD